MYIKIKNIKYTLLSLACIFFASYTYSKYVKADDISTNDTTASSIDSTSLTASFAQDLQAYISSREGQTVSSSDINDFVDKEMAAKVGSPITWDTLPNIDQAQIKILKQDYSTLSKESKKQKLQQDASQYLYQIAYLLVSNSPQLMLSTTDFQTFQSDFMNRLSDFSDPANIAYFSDLGNRLNTFSKQINNVQVPESMLDIHVKFLKLIAGFLSLRDMPSSDNADDPMEQMLILSKAKELVLLTSDFFANNITDYFNQINS